MHLILGTAQLSLYLWVELQVLLGSIHLDSHLRRRPAVRIRGVRRQQYRKWGWLLIQLHRRGGLGVLWRRTVQLSNGSQGPRYVVRRVLVSALH